MGNPLRRRSPLDLSPRAKLVSYVLLIAWSLVVLFPLYWLAVTSLKQPVQVDKGPFYIPFLDFQPTLDAWKNILVDLGNDTIRPYVKGRGTLQFRASEPLPLDVIRRIVEIRVRQCAAEARA